MSDGSLFNLHQRLPPVMIQAEQALLGALMANNKAFALVGQFLEPTHFADPIHGAIFEAIRRRIGTGQLVDAVILSSELRNSPVLEQVGGVAYLAQLLSAMVGLINAGEYGKAIFDAWHRRELIDIGETLVNLSFAPEGRTGRQIQDDIETRLLKLVERDANGARRHVMLDEAVSAALAAADAAIGREGPAGLSTGFSGVDDVLNGLEDDTLNVLAGRPGMGKSALGWQWTINAARQGVGTLAVSLEMSATQLGRRALSAVSGVPLWRLKRGQHEGEAERLVLAQREMHGMPLSIEDGSGLTAATITMKARAAHKRHGLGLIMIDHLHIVRPEDADLRQGATWAVGRISGAMKRLAKEFRCPVLLLAQLNRGLEGRDDKRPALQDLRQSGDIEQDADSVSFVYRPEYYLPKSAPDKKDGETSEKHAGRVKDWFDAKERLAGKAELIIEKVRDGQPAMVPLKFDAHTTSFYGTENSER